MGIVENTYAELKQQELKNNPYSCLHMADIDINPHQIEAFTFALSSLELGGAILADEVGLGKTIEAGLVIKYLLCSGKDKILLIMPSNLRKQWQVELEEKFDIDSLIVDSSNWEDYLARVKSKQAVIIVSYHFASKRKTEFGKIAWDFCVFDEAHRLRNVYKNGSKMANSLYELTKGIPKILLTATPMQNTLSHAGYEGQILKFNGSTNDPVTKQIYKAWKARNYGKYVGSRNVELKNAIVEAFRDEYKILLVTDSGSEGLNLQFCNTIINYDLPWNPQKIEQRIGRCHRYGQKNDVVVINLLNTQNVADKRVYEILSEKFELFQGVFGASDKAIGLLESGADFEKRVTLIYQECKTTSDFAKQFKNLEKELEKKRNKKMDELKSIFIYKTEEQHKSHFNIIIKEIAEYDSKFKYCNSISKD